MVKVFAIALLSVALITGVSFASPGLGVQNVYADCDAGDE